MIQARGYEIGKRGTKVPVLIYLTYTAKLGVYGKRY